MPEESAPQRIAREITRDVMGGRYKPGEWLPRNPQMAARFGVSVPTLQRAYEILEFNGVVKRFRGVGVQVCADVVSKGRRAP